MQSKLLRVPAWGAAHSDLVERRLQRYCPRFQGAVRALAMRHSRIADLAVSFPALLFALAVPRPGLDPTRALELAIEGAALAEVAAAADVPMWLRRLPPEALADPIMKLPDGELFRRQIANHLPRSPKIAPVWLRTVADVADWAHEAAAVWIAREVVRGNRRALLNRLRLVSLWAWFSGQPDTLGHSLIEKPWTPAMRIGTALDAAEGWRTTVTLYVNLGREPIADVWLQPARVGGFDFLPLTSTTAIIEEATAMRNCLCTYGHRVARNSIRLWSIRRDGQRVATLSLTNYHCDPLPNIGELKGPRNAGASPEVWWAARQWIHMHGLRQIDMKRCSGPIPVNRDAWIALWRPYWLAKRRLPHWLPIAPSRGALRAL
jgi:hypothetical protein